MTDTALTIATAAAQALHAEYYIDPEPSAYAIAILDALGIEHDAVPVSLIANLRMVHRGDEPAEPEGDGVQAYRIKRTGQ